jgi:hypothetical protein
MFDGLLQWYFIFGIIQNGTKPAVNLKYRPIVNQRLFYRTTEIQRYVSEINESIEQRVIESVEKLVDIDTNTIHIVNINVKIIPLNMTKLTRYKKRPYFDRLKEHELPGDFRSQDHPFGYNWMLFPSSSSLMTPKYNFYEGQQWSVKMPGNNFQVHYELTKIDHEFNIAHVQARDGICRHDWDGEKRWNASWTVDTRSGVIKRMQLDLDHRHESPARTTRTQTIKILTHEADDQTIFDYEIDDDIHDDL